MKILDDRQIRQKIRRLAIEILERNFGETSLILAGLNNNGSCFAQLLLAELMPIAPPDMELTLTRIRLNPANPLEYEAMLEMPIEELRGKNIIIADDVANTGRTIFYAIQPLLQTVPRKVEVAVLVDRKHKSFPIHSDYVGLSLATTLQEDIDCQIREVDEMAVFLN
ncbi:MAG: phosphoribosyltransferase family protein [Saprospiraceae bacterium]